jgi:hypothetical protein
MTGPAATDNPETRFDRNAGLLLAGALIFLVLNLAHLVYRFSLPTAGWENSSDNNPPGVYGLYVGKNVVGASSPLLPGDVLQSIGGIAAERIVNNDQLYTPPPPGWRAGGHVTVSVIRSGKTLTFDIPIVHWTFAALLRSNFADWGSLLEWLSAVIMLGVGLLTVLKRPGSLAARFLFLFGVAQFSTTLAGSLPDELSGYFNRSVVFAEAIFRYVIFPYLLGPSLLGFALTFPRPKAFIQRRPWLLAIPFLVGSSAPALLFIAATLSTIGFPITLGMVLASIAALLHSALTMRDAISRAQLRWAVGGVVLGLGLFTLNYLPLGFFDNFLGVGAPLGLPVMGLSLMVAILRYRLFDIDLIIRRTLVYALLTVLLGLVYFGGVTLLQSLFTAASGQSSAAALVISTLLIAALFNPLRRRIQDFIDRRFYRRKYDAGQALMRFAAAARAETDLETLTGQLTSLVGETIQPERLSLWLKERHK